MTHRPAKPTRRTQAALRATLVGLALTAAGCGDSPPPADNPADAAQTQPSPATANPPADALTAAEITRQFRTRQADLDALLALAPTTDVTQPFAAKLNDFRLLIIRTENAALAPDGRAATADARQQCTRFDRALQRLQDENTMLEDATPLTEAGAWQEALKLWQIHPLLHRYPLKDLPRLQAAIKNAEAHLDHPPTP